MNPLISVIIPVYNVEKYLQSCLDSIMFQTYSNLEIILVNDGSSDNSGKICDAAAASDSRVKVIHQENAGPSAARNVGVAVSIGDLIGFVDSDDYIDASLFEKVVAVFEKTGTDIVVFSSSIINEKGKIIGALDNQQGVFSPPKAALCALLDGEIDDYVWNKVCKRHVFDNVYYPVGYMWEDMGTTYKLFINAGKVVSIPDRLYFYRVSKGNITSNISEKKLADIYLMKKCKHDGITSIYNDLTEVGVESLAKSALSLYDRSLWASVDIDVLASACNYLEENRETLLKCSRDFAINLYYRSVKVYRILRLMRHKLGEIVRVVCR